MDFALGKTDEAASEAIAAIRPQVVDVLTRARTTVNLIADNVPELRARALATLDGVDAAVTDARVLIAQLTRIATTAEEILAKYESGEIEFSVRPKT